MTDPTRTELFIATLAAMLEAERDLQRARRLRRNRAAARRYIAAVPTRFATAPAQDDPADRGVGPGPQVAG